jgi:outer membrane protein W
MKSQFKRLMAFSFGLVMVLALAAEAGSLAGRSRIEVGAGIRHHDSHNRTEIHWDDGIYVGSSSGAVGSVTLSYWDNETLAMALGYTVHDVETDQWVDFYGYVIDETVVVHSLMLGLRYYLPQSRPYSAVRPYLAAGAGPFFGTTSYVENDHCDCEYYSEVEHQTVFGARLGGGVDFQLGRRFMFGATGAYNFVDDFSEPIGGRYDYSGSEFGISLSYLFGRRGR